MKFKLLALLIASSFALAGCNNSSDDNNADTPKQPDKPATEQPAIPDLPTVPEIVNPSGKSSDQLARMMEIYVETDSRLNRNKTFGEINDQYADARNANEYNFEQAMQLIDRNDLTDSEKIYYDMFVFDREIAVRGAEFPNQRFGSFETPLSHFRNNIVRWGNYAGRSIQINVVKDFTAWIQELNAQYHQGQAENIQLSKIVTLQYLNGIHSNFPNGDYSALRVGLDSMTRNDGDDIAYDNFESAVNEMEASVKSLVTFLETDYLDSSNGFGKITDSNVGYGNLPNGASWYQWQLDRNSTSGKSAKELYDLGMDLTLGGNDEMIRVAKFVATKEETQNWYNERNDYVDLPAFFEFLQGDRFIFGKGDNSTSGTEYAEQCVPASDTGSCESSMLDYYAAKDAFNALVPTYFKPIKTDYKIVPIPASGEAFQGVGSYGSGEFNLNTKPGNSLQKWNVSTLTMHEAGFGHHLQFAYKVEFPVKNIPEYIKNSHYTAYAEGWALYVEDLAKEAGVYGVVNDEGNPTFVDGTGMCKAALDYSTFSNGAYVDAEECNALQYMGQLNEAQLRNMRLAVDTGIHYKGWSIQKARDFMHSNSALGQGDITSESLRYAAYVGQAVSYKSGFLVISELRDQAREQLGDDFSYADFHNQVLSYGGQPLEVLKTNITDWLKTK